MSLKNIRSFVSTLLLISSPFFLSAQSGGTGSDSLWCDHLDEIIKCASVFQITDRVRPGLRDSTTIAPFRPDITLTKNGREMIWKEYNKVVYSAYLFSADRDDAALEKEFDKWYRKIKMCIPQWEEARLANADPSLSAPQDHFFTNSEDETTLRLDIFQDRGYHVRLRIY